MKIKGHKISITGYFYFKGIQIPRRIIRSLIEKNAGYFRSSSEGVDYLVIGSYLNPRTEFKNRSKLKIAATRKVSVITDKELVRSLRSSDVKLLQRYIDKKKAA